MAILSEVVILTINIEWVSSHQHCPTSASHNFGLVIHQASKMQANADLIQGSTSYGAFDDIDIAEELEGEVLMSSLRETRPTPALRKDECYRLLPTRIHLLVITLPGCRMFRQMIRSPYCWL